MLSNMVTGLDNATKVGMEMVEYQLAVALERVSFAIDIAESQIHVLMVLKDRAGDEVGIKSTVPMEHLYVASCPWRHIGTRMVQDMSEYIREHELPENPRGEA